MANMTKNKKQNLNKTKSTSTTKKIVIIFSSIFGVILICLAILYMILNFSGEQLQTQKLVGNPANTKIFDKNNQLVDCQFDDMYCDIDKLAKHTIDAFISIEDKRFYKHNGIDYRRILSAMATNIKRGKIIEGGSTITQQVIKNTHLDSKKTLNRKFNEARLAIKLEKQFTKQEILGFYLNLIYFGNGEYGIENASQRFFGKSSYELSLMESAMLAAIPKSPTKYNLAHNLDNNLTRAKVVLKAMLDQKKITQNEHDTAINQEIVIKNSLIENNFKNNYFENTIFEACNILGLTKKQLLSGKYIIKTYYDSQQQQSMASIINDDTYSRNCNFIPNKIGICVDNKSYGISACDSNFKVNLFNYKRQLGSTLKPLAVYAPSIDMRLVNPMTKIDDSPKTFSDYSPRNYQDKYFGMTSITQCLINSQNVPAVELLTKLGTDKSIEYLRKMGFDVGNQDKNLSLALGATTNGNTLLELAGGYCTLANDGKYSKIGFIQSISDSKGKQVYNHNIQSVQVFDQITAAQVNEMLKECADNGTAKKLSTLDFEIASKTGTVSAKDKNFNTDIYNVSYTPDNTVIFWQGSLDNNLLPQSMSGGGQTTAMSKNFFENTQQNKKLFNRPNNLIEIFIDKYSYDNLNEIVIASENCPSYAKIRCLYDRQNLPQKINTSFDNLHIKNAKLTTDVNGKLLTFDADPRLFYDVYKKEFLKEEILVEQIIGKDEQVSIDLGNEHGCYTSYKIVPFYYNDFGDKVFGQEAKFNSIFGRLLDFE